MANKELAIRTYVNGTESDPTFHGITIVDYKYTAQRMGMPTLTATLMHPTCLDKEWTHKEYVLFRGEKYFIRQVPSSSKDNTDIRYKHEIQFVSERQQLTQIYFYDDVDRRLATLTANKWCSNSSVFTFFGNIHEFVDRLNFALLKGKVGDSGIGAPRKASDGSISVKGDGYYAVVEAVGDYDFEAVKEMSFEDTYIFDAMTQAFDLWGIPFRFEGRRIIFGGGFKQIDKVFKYGRENELLKIQRQNQNIRIVNRVTGLGGTTNIPFYYPNDSEYDNIKLNAADGNKVVTADSISVRNYHKLFAGPSQDEQLTYTKTVTAVLSEDKIWASYYNGYKYSHMDILPSEWKGLMLGRWIKPYTMPTTVNGGQYYSHDTITFRVNVKVVAAGIIHFKDLIGRYYWKNTKNGQTYTSPIGNLRGGTTYFTPHHFYAKSGDRKPLGFGSDSEYMSKGDGSGGFYIGAKGVQNGEPISGNVTPGDYYLEFDLHIGVGTGYYQIQVEIDDIGIEADPIVEYFWQGTNKRYPSLKEIGIKFDKELTDEAIGDTISWTRQGEMMPYQTNLIPPIFRDTWGAERFYNAVNGMYYPASAIADKYADNKEQYCWAWDSRNAWAGWSAPHTGTRGEIWRVPLKVQSNGTYRADLSYSTRANSNPLPLSSKYPYIALKARLPKDAVITWDIVDKDNVPHTLSAEKKQQVTLPNGDTLLMCELNPTWAPLIIFQIKIADIPAANIVSGQEYYDVFWIRAFESFRDAEDFAALESYHFNNEYLAGNPCEYIFKDESIHPTIEDVTNANGELMGVVADVAYDENDSDDYLVSSDGDDEGKLKHSFFYIKLNIFNGPWGFDLFKSAIENGPMTIQMVSGNCNGCKFKIQAAEVGESGEQVFHNPVQVDGNGNLVAGDANAKVNADNIIASQQDTETNSIWIIVQKDDNTFGVVHPNRTNNYLVQKGDKFNITDILLPKAYILAAEQRLKDAAIKYMSQNNDEKFAFDFSFSRIYLAENPGMETMLNEDCNIKLEYNGITYILYASSYDYEVKSGEALPNIKVNVSDVIASDKGYAEQITDSVATEVGRNLLSIGTAESMFPLDELYALLDQRYQRQAQTDTRYLSKIENDRAAGSIASDSQFEVGRFISGTQGGLFSVDPATGQSYLEVDRITARIKAYFESVESAHVASIGGKFIITKGGNITISFVDEVDDVYRCHFQNKQELEVVQHRFYVGDWAYCQFWNFTQGATPQTNRYYWRPVVAIGEDYIDLDANPDFGDAPMIGDVIVQLGSELSDSQSAIVLSTADEFSPDISLYEGISHNSLDGCLVARFGNLTGIIENGKALEGHGIWCGSAYLHGSFSVKTDSGEVNLFDYVQTQFEVVNGRFSSVIKEVGAATEKVSEISQTVDGISLKVNEIVDNTINPNLLDFTNEGKRNWVHHSTPPFINDVSFPIEDNSVGSKIGYIFTIERNNDVVLQSEYLIFKFDATQLEVGQKYTLSFYSLGDTGLQLRTFIGTNNMTIPYTESNIITLQDSDWQRHEFVIEPNRKCPNGAGLIFEFVNDIGVWLHVDIADLKLERGEVATPWVVNESKRTADKLLATGIDIEQQKVTVTSDNFIIKNNSGATTAMIDRDGKLNVNIINTKELTANKVICEDSQTGKFVSSINANGDGSFILYGEDGITPRVRFGFQKESGNNASFIQYYDAEGFQQWILDINGTFGKKPLSETNIDMYLFNLAGQNSYYSPRSKQFLPNSGVFHYIKKEGGVIVTDEYRVGGLPVTGEYCDCLYVDKGPYQGPNDDLHLYARTKYTFVDGQITEQSEITFVELGPESEKSALFSV